jgi:phospholipid/cholesterol/gamma-HCH transport system substrate-binding protein
MENKAHYALIGLFVLLSMIAALAFMAWLSNAQFDQQFDEYEVSFSGPVRGLSQGSEVRFNGLKVGEVLGLRLDPKDTNTVLAEIQVIADTPVDTKSYARLEPLGLTGLSYIQIFSGGEEFPLLKDLPGKGPKRIEGQMSQLDTFLDGGGSVIESAGRALNAVNVVLSEDAVEDFHQILENIQRITADLNTSELDMEQINGMFASVAQAADRIAVTAESITGTSNSLKGVVDKDVKELLARTEQSLDNLDTALASYDSLAIESNELVVDTRDAINRLSNSGLTDLEETVDAIRRLVETLGRVADSLEQNPSQFIVGSERETVDIPQ